MTQIAVPLVSPEPPIPEQLTQVQAAGANLVELRVDLIADEDAVRAALAAPRTLPLILTVRSQAEGGAWDGDDAQRVALIESLGLQLPGYVDVELATWERSANLRQKVGLVCDRLDAPSTPGARRKNQLILSLHDLTGTPDDLSAVFDRLEAAPAHVLKAVFTPRDVRDALRVLEQLALRARRRSWIALAMGDAGLITRVLAAKFNALLTFAAQHAAAASAPGQMPLELLLEQYRFRSISAATRVYGVVGWPTAHSLSPLLHNRWMRQAGIDGVYLPLPVSPSYEAFADLMQTVQRFAQLDLHGLSVTIPHKEHALRWLREHGAAISPAAQSAGAVNTLLREAGGAWRGDNTDGAGALHALHAAGCGTLAQRRVLVLGAGGAARGVAAALIAAGAQVTIVNRSADRAADLGAALNCTAGAWEQRAALPADIVINCTSVGMSPEVDQTPLPAAGLRRRPLVLDTVYRPRVTRLLREAQAAGCPIVSGVDMFLAQAALQFQLWHGASPPPGDAAAPGDAEAALRAALDA